MSDAHEVELKFLCAPQDLDAVLALAPSGDDESRELISVYFDTPDRDLQKAGASLRVRESRGRRVQTLKRGDGLMREEHERAIAGLIPEPDIGPLRDILPDEGIEALKPAFNVRITRRQRTLRYQGAEIELALDLGEVADGPRTSPISEVELELKSGSPAALFALAADLVQSAPLYLSFDSKAAQGRALAGPPPRVRPVVLPPKATAGMALQATARAALVQIAANAALLRAGPDPKAVHRLRVATRRLRSAFSTFRPIVAGYGADHLKAELRWLSKASDEARNLDVLAGILLDPLLEPQPPTAALEAAVALSRRAAQRGVCEAVATPRFRALMVEALAWVETGAWMIAPGAQRPARAFARKALDSRRRQVLKRGQALEKATDHARHDLRIAAKKLRYAADGFAGVFGRKASRRFAGQLKQVQNALGALNDLATAEPLIARLNLPPDLAFEAGKRLGLVARGGPAHLAEARKALKALANDDPYWR